MAKNDHFQVFNYKIMMYTKTHNVQIKKSNKMAKMCSIIKIVIYVFKVFTGGGHF